MSDSTGYSDETDDTATDWFAFEFRLESRMTAIGPGGFLAIDLSDVAGSLAPYFQIVQSPDGEELYAELSSDQFLSEHSTMTPDVVRSLLGQAPCSGVTGF